MSYAQTVKWIDELVAENTRLKAQIAAGSTSGVRSNAKKLTKREVGLMKDLKRLGSTNQELATAFDVHPATVSRIIRGVYWK
jgi:DNA-binding NarL/FixJ family response regulator